MSRLLALIVLLSLFASCRTYEAGPAVCPGLGISAGTPNSGQKKPKTKRHLFQRDQPGGQSARTVQRAKAKRGKSQRKQEKENRKKSRHPQLGLFPKGVM